ncbi:hypothetical protein ACXZ65_35805 [Streptomyces aculeolatus]
MHSLATAYPEEGWAAASQVGEDGAGHAYLLRSPPSRPSTSPRRPSRA